MAARIDHLVTSGHVLPRRRHLGRRQQRLDRRRRPRGDRHRRRPRRRRHRRGRRRPAADRHRVHPRPQRPHRRRPRPRRPHRRPDPAAPRRPAAVEADPPRPRARRVSSPTARCSRSPGADLTRAAHPGHAPGAVCLYAPGLGTVFTGDTLFQGGPGATGRSYSHFPTIIDSIRDRLLDPAARDGGPHRTRRRRPPSAPRRRTWRSGSPAATDGQGPGHTGGRPPQRRGAPTRTYTAMMFVQAATGSPGVRKTRRSASTANTSQPSGRRPTRCPPRPSRTPPSPSRPPRSAAGPRRSG